MLANAPQPVSDPTILIQGVLLFVITGILMVLGALLAGGLLRRKLPNPVKGEAYECGEPAIGQSWVQFDLRFYVVGLVFVIADVAIAFFYPWAVNFKYGGTPALLAAFTFFGMLGVGYAYLWRFGYLDWVRSTDGQRADDPR